MSSIFDLVPGLSEKMDHILKKYEKYHHKTYNEKMTSKVTTDKMYLYSESINNTVTISSKPMKIKPSNDPTNNK